MTARLERVDPASSPAGPHASRERPGVSALLEVLAVAAAPGILYVVLCLRGMAPAHLPDPSMHSTYIFDPHAIFARYQAVFTPTSRLREAARVGFLVPARITYLLSARYRASSPSGTCWRWWRSCPSTCSCAVYTVDGPDSWRSR